MQVLQTRGEVIRWAGAVHAYPVLRAGKPELSRAGEDETGATRTGWKQFFAAERGLVLVIEAPDQFAHRFLEKHQAKSELPPAAFGPPLFDRVWHEVTLSKPPAPPPAP